MRQPTFTLPSALALALAVVMAASYAQGSDQKLEAPISVESDRVKWRPGPPSLPEGAQIAVLEGDLSKAGPYTMRLKFPDGYRVAPHSHPVREHITVLEGTLMMGMGKSFDRAATKPLGPGSLFVLPVGDHHYVWTKGETVVQLHGTGPWGIDYVNPEDDPRNK